MPIRLASIRAFTMSVKGPGFDPQYCLFRNLCSKLVNCHHLTTPLINQRHYDTASAPQPGKTCLGKEAEDQCVEAVNAIQVIPHLAGISV